MVREHLCAPDVELCLCPYDPFTCPVVYKHPKANTAKALNEILDLSQKRDSLSPDAPKRILWDFNSCSLRNTLCTCILCHDKAHAGRL